MDWFSKAEGRTAVNQCGRAQLDSPGVYGKERLQIQLRSSLLAPTPRNTLSPSHTYFMSIQCSKYSMFPYSSCCSAYFDSTQPSVLEWLLYKGIKIATLNYWQTRHVLHLEQRVFQKFSSSIHLESSHCSALSSCTGTSCCTFSPNPDFTPILIQPSRDLSFQNILPSALLRIPGMRGGQTVISRADLPDSFFIFTVSTGVYTPRLRKATKISSAWPKRTSPSLFLGKTDHLSCLKVSMQTAR